MHNEHTRRYYNEVGWTGPQNLPEDARRWEDTRPCAQKYVIDHQTSFAKHLPTGGERMLDFGCGPIESDAYRSLSQNFKMRYCLDFSEYAYERNRELLGSHGVCICDDVLDVSFPDNFFDSTISSHSLYHVEKDLQETVMRQLLSWT